MLSSSLGLTGYSERLSSFLEREKEEEKRQTKYLWPSLTLNHKTAQILVPFGFQKKNKKKKSTLHEKAEKPTLGTY